MHQHWNQHLNVSKLLEDSGAKWILELGVGGGKNTRLLATKVRVVCVDISKCPEGMEDMENVRWVTGISYLEIPRYDNIPFAIIDTDHNGWTLDRELKALDERTSVGSVVCMHDMMSFGNTNGFHNGYGGLGDYPKAEMEAGPNMTITLKNFIADRRWNVIASTKESNGAVAIRKER